MFEFHPQVMDIVPMGYFPMETTQFPPLFEGEGILSTFRKVVKGAKKLGSKSAQALSGERATSIKNILSQISPNPESRPSFRGEKHMILPTRFGPTIANFAGPQTRLQERLRRGDKGVDGPRGIDEIAKIHDIEYSQAQTPEDIRKADEKMIRLVGQSDQNKRIKQLVIAALKAKVFGEKTGIFGPEAFTDIPSLKPLAGQELKQKLLRQERMEGSGLFSTLVSIALPAIIAGL